MSIFDKYENIIKIHIVLIAHKIILIFVWLSLQNINKKYADISSKVRKAIIIF